MPFLIGPDFFLSKSEVFLEVEKKARALSGQIKDYQGVIGIYADTSRIGVLLVLSAIFAGLRIALCPTRDPSKINEKWLQSVGCNLVFSSIPQIKFDSIRSFYIEELLPDEGHFDPLPQNFCSLIRTSGTTGLPKTAQLSFGAHWASALSVVEHFSYTSKSIWALLLPLYHVSGLSIIFRALRKGGGIFIGKEQNIKNFIDEGLISHISLVPALLTRLINQKAHLDKISNIIIGGEKFSGFVTDNLASTYGMTETASMIYVNQHKAGLVLPHAKMKINRDGTVLVGGASLFDGYIIDGGLHLPVNSEGLFATSDVGFINEYHQLSIRYRKDNTVIWLGENIQLEEIENLLNQHPLIDHALITPITISDSLSLVAVLKPIESNINFEEIKKYLQERLPSLKIPKTYFYWPAHININEKGSRSLIKEWVARRLLT